MFEYIPPEKNVKTNIRGLENKKLLWLDIKYTGRNIDFPLSHIKTA